MMVKVTEQWHEISRFASMWNMEGLVLIGFCEQDYKKLRDTMHIPFVVYDGFFDEPGKMANIVVDNYQGGMLAGEYLKAKGHQKVLCISDNAICMDWERYQGLKKIMPRAELMLVPMKKDERYEFYRSQLEVIRSYTAIFAVSDYYAVDVMHFLQSEGLSIPGDLSVIGFDDTQLGRIVLPALTTIRQDNRERAQKSLELLEELKLDQNNGATIKIKVSLVERESVQALHQSF